MELQDERVLVTGATAGIGQETAKLFARRGASVVITGRDTKRGGQLGQDRPGAITRFRRMLR